jgi:thiol-disulfide isomerase/thioredoxin
MIRTFATAVAVYSALTVGLASAGVAASAASSPSLTTLTQASTWFNGKPAERELRGRVVLVDFYTFNCINCKHTEPNLRALFRQHAPSALRIIGVHSPETAYEKDSANVAASLKEQGIAWPVALDNDFALWNAYGVDAWPTQMIFDRHGKLRATIVGEGQDDKINSTIDALIAER